jgi:hypothetical protein
MVTARWSPLLRDVIVEAELLPQPGRRLPQQVWQTCLATEPASAPLVESDGKVLLVGHHGAVWRIDRENLRGPAAESLTSERRSIGRLLVTPTGSHVYAPGDDNPQWLFAEGAAQTPRLVLLQDPGRHRLDTDPVLFASGMLLCMREGPVFLVHPATGDVIGQPLPWPASFAQGSHWRTPGVSNSGFAVLANDQGLLLRLEAPDGQQQLVVDQSSDLKSRLPSSPLVVGPHVYVVSRGTEHDALLVLASDTLLPVASFNLEQRAIPPLFAIGNRVVVQTDTEMRTFEDADQSWQAPLPFGPLAGSPVLVDDRWLCATRDGHAYWLDVDSGRVQPTRRDRPGSTPPSTADGEPPTEASGTVPPARLAAEKLTTIDVGQALGASAANWGSSILLVGHDGTLHIVPLGSGGEAP